MKQRLGNLLQLLQRVAFLVQFLINKKNNRDISNMKTTCDTNTLLAHQLM